MFLGHRHYLVVVLLGWFVDGFKVEFSLIWGSKIHKKSIKKPSKRPSMTRCKLGWMLDGSWIDFWWIFGPSWGAKWVQVGTQIGKIASPRGHQKRCTKQGTQVDAGRRKYTRVHARKGGPHSPSDQTTLRDWGTPEGLRECFGAAYRPLRQGAWPIYIYIYIFLYIYAHINICIYIYTYIYVYI